jgi:hypothetical protein
VDELLGDASKGWQSGLAATVELAELVRLMVNADLQTSLELHQCQDVIRQISQSNGLKISRQGSRD